LEVYTLCGCGLGDIAIEQIGLDAAEWVFSRMISEMVNPDLVPPDVRRRIQEHEPLRTDAILALLNLRQGYVWLLRGSGRAAYGFGFNHAHGFFDHILLLHPGNTAVRREAALVLGRASQAMRCEGAFGAACILSNRAIQIMETLVAEDVSNRSWQADLAYYHLWHGEAQRDRGDSVTARSHFEAAERLTSRLMAADPDNAQWRTAKREVLVRLEVLPALDDLVPPVAEPVWDYERPSRISSSSETDPTRVLPTPGAPKV
jgi:hypothetical protein